jgi:hypothetical protein
MSRALGAALLLLLAACGRQEPPPPPAPSLDATRAEAAALDGLAPTAAEEEAAVAALERLAAAKDDLARFKIELHLARDPGRPPRLRETSRIALALALSHYPGTPAGDSLWTALGDAGESPGVRGAALKALRTHHPADLEERILRLEPAPGDEWLRELKARLK